MKLVADGGSTKTDWCLIDEQGNLKKFVTEGYNPYFVSSGYVVTSLNQHLLHQLTPGNIQEVYFYGAGCSEDKSPVITLALQEVFPKAVVEVNLDLVAAAHAQLGSSPGFIAILGTGSNTGIFDGKQISYQVDSLGYILGDEGSGCAIGKKLLIEYVRKFMPKDIEEQFEQEFGLSAPYILDCIYNKPLANRFCAGFAKFINEQNIQQEYLRHLVISSFREFFQNLVSRYPNYQQYTFNCVGSIGYLFQDLLTQVAAEFHMPIGQIERSPINNLARYHAALAPVGTTP